MAAHWPSVTTLERIFSLINDQEAWSAAFDADLKNFLRCRGREFNKGGVFVLVLPASDSSCPGSPTVATYQQHVISLSFSEFYFKQSLISYTIPKWSYLTVV